MRRHKLVIGKKRAQAMVEFALALPILLLLLYGILEAGRLLFIYSSVVTASRQAVRYGSATGMGLDYTPDGGPDNSAVQRYRDCYGIRRAAQRADFLNSFEDTDIRIFYDDGPTTPPSDTGAGEQEICTGGANYWGDYDPDNGTRLVVKINGDFLPLVPGLVPFIRRSADDTPPDPIRGVSARTILVSVSIIVTVPPSSWLPSGPMATSAAATSAAATSAVSTSVAATSAAATSAAATSSAETAAPTNTSTSTPPPTATATVTNTPGGPTATATDVPPTSTATAIPPTGTATSILATATATGTQVAMCSQITSTGTFSKAGNTMTVTITNPNNYPVTLNNVFVVWNGDRGHTATGQGDDTLNLVSASLGGTVFWSDANPLPASSKTIVPQTAATIPASVTNLTLNFNFHQSYDRWDTPPSERVTITFNDPTGCDLNVLDLVRQ